MVINSKNNYVQTDIGEVPVGWKTVKLKRFIKIMREGISPSEFPQKTFYLYSVAGYDNNKTPEMLLGKEIKSMKYLVIPRSILFPKLNPRFERVWKIKNVSENSVCSTEFLPLLNVDERASHDYLYYLLRSKYVLGNIQNATTGTSASHQRIKLQTLQQLKVPYPCIREQKVIASILSSLDSKIEINHKLNRTLEEIGKALFGHWFVDFEFPNNEGKPYKSNGGKMVESKLGKIPKDWNMGAFDDFIGELESGRRPKGGVSKYKNGIPSIGAGNINGLMQSDFTNIKFIPEFFFQSMRKGLIKDLDILVYKDGGAPGVFKPRFSIFGFGYPFDKMAINEHVFRVQGKSIEKHTYLYFWMDGHYCREQLEVIGTKAAIPGINSTDFRGLDILIPSSELLLEFNSIALKIITTILRNNKQSLTLQKIRNSLLPRLISGKLKAN